MTPWEYYDEFVNPNFHDFENARGDLRMAFNAAVSAFQLGDHFYRYFRRNDPRIVERWKDTRALHQYLRHIEPAFGTVQSVATAYKHLYLAAAHYDTSSPGAVRAVTLPHLGLLIEDRLHVEDPREVVVTRRDGSEVVLYDCLRRVVRNMWPQVMPSPNGLAI
jgi:hypothetical protein